MVTLIRIYPLVFHKSPFYKDISTVSAREEVLKWDFWLSVYLELYLPFYLYFFPNKIKGISVLKCLETWKENVRNSGSHNLGIQFTTWIDLTVFQPTCRTNLSLKSPPSATLLLLHSFLLWLIMSEIWNQVSCTIINLVSILQVTNNHVIQ